MQPVSGFVEQGGLPGGRARRPSSPGRGMVSAAPAPLPVPSGPRVASSTKPSIPARRGSVLMLHFLSEKRGQSQPRHQVSISQLRVSSGGRWADSLSQQQAKLPFDPSFTPAGFTFGSKNGRVLVSQCLLRGAVSISVKVKALVTFVAGQSPGRLPLGRTRALQRITRSPGEASFYVRVLLKKREGKRTIHKRQAPTDWEAALSLLS